MKNKFKLVLVTLILLPLWLAGCPDDNKVANQGPGNGTDNVFKGLPYNGITVSLPSGAKLIKDDGTSYSTSFSMTIAPNNQFVMSNGVKYVPSYWTYPAHPGPLDFFAVSEHDYSQADSPIAGALFPWARARYAIEGHGTVVDSGGRFYFNGEIIVYQMNAATDFSFDTGTFGLRISFGGTEPPQRIGVISNR